MTTAIWIIAIVEVVRAVQNFIQIRQIKKQSVNPYMKTATDAFIRSLDRTDREFLSGLADKFMEQEDNE